MKDLKISKELLSEVLKLEVVKHSLYNELHKSFNITYMPSEDSLKSRWMPINICEFAFKCKEWARDKYNITISSALYSNYAKSWNVDKDKSYTAKTEVEVIIKACECILEELKK